MRLRTTPDGLIVDDPASGGWISLPAALSVAGPEHDAVVPFAMRSLRASSVRLEIDGIGTLTNRVVRAPAPAPATPRVVVPA